MNQSFSKLKIILIYALFGSLWIFYSDKILTTLVKDIETINSIQSYKGWFFIFITSMLLYYLINLYEKEKLELSKLHKTIFYNAREGMFLHELDGTVIDVNPYIERLNNVSKDKLIGMNISSFVKEENLEKTKALRDKLMTKGEVKFELEHQKIDGSSFYASITSQLIEFEGRQIVYCTLKDLTVAKENILLLERSKELFDNINEGVMVTNQDGYITEVNKAFISITGYSYQQALGNNASILKSREHNERFYNKLWNSLKKRNKWSGNIINKKKNGEIYTSFLTISAIKDKSGKVQSYIGIFADISNVLKYEKELREKDILLIQQSKMAAMGEMIDNIAHQWKQPLSIISMSNGLLKFNQEDETFSSKEEVDKAIENIEKGVNHLSSTIDDFRNFFSPDKTKKEFLISNCIDRVIILLKSKLKNKNIQIVKELEKLNIYGVENELAQVIINIVINAIDAFKDSTIKDKYIFINSYKKDNLAIISIKDNACGIPEDILDKVFNTRFTTKDEGTGIGLYMSKNIIESYKGSLSVENSEYLYNDDEFKGANFIIRLPLV